MYQAYEITCRRRAILSYLIERNNYIRCICYPLRKCSFENLLQLHHNGWINMIIDMITNNEMLFDKGTQNRESLIVHLVS